MANQDDLFGLNDSSVDGKPSPSDKVVMWFHGKASTDQPTDIHHRIGFGDTDAASGSHTHDGKNSKPLFNIDQVPADLASGASLAQTITAVNRILELIRKVSG